MKIIPVCVYEFKVLSGKGKGAKIKLGIKQGKNQFARATLKLKNLLIDYEYMVDGQKIVYTSKNDNFEYGNDWIKISHDTLPGILY